MNKWGKLGLLAGLTSAAMSTGLAIKGLVDEIKDQRTLNAIRNSKDEIMDHQDMLYQNMLMKNRELLDESLRKNEP